MGPQHHLPAALICLLFYTITGQVDATGKGKKSEIVCESSSKTISCPNNGVISIKKAFYGRSKSSVCPGQGTDVKNCNADLANGVVTYSCNGKHSCILESKNDIFGDPCPGITKYLEVEYECQKDRKSEIICESNSLTISCPNNGIINIKKASYGRTRNTVCPGSLTEVTNCHADRAYSVVTYGCNGKHSCTLESKNDLFGDPCPGTTKYLDVEYECQRDKKSDIVCEGSSKTISCPNKLTLNIKSASYGRTSNSVCSGQLTDITNCHADIAHSVVTYGCNGKQSCTLESTNSIFGDPCPGTIKYLEVEYDCQSEKNSDIVCEGSSKTISCPNKLTLNIKSASYGRTSNSVCSGQLTDITNCHADIAHSVVTYGCNGKQSCTLESTNSIFGDPCPGTIKYLEVEYDCQSGKSEIICESYSKTISCPNNGIINIKKATYGRSVSSLCSGANTHITNCHADLAYGIVTYGCNGKNSCNLESTNNIFGDPCAGTTKYLEVQYDCESVASMGTPAPSNEPSKPSSAALPLSLNEHTTKSTSLACPKSQTEAKRKLFCKEDLIFHEKFNSWTPDVWKHEIFMPNEPDYEFVVFAGNRQNIFFENGLLVIKPTMFDDDHVRRGKLSLEDCTGKLFTDECEREGKSFSILPPVQSARITTKESFSFKYGKVRIRARLPAGDWLVPEIWLEPKLRAYGPGYQSGRIRIAHSFGNLDLHSQGQNIGSKMLESSFLLGIGSKVLGKKQVQLQSNRKSWFEDFHNYTLIWTPDNISFQIDDGEVNHLLDPNHGKLFIEAGFDEEDGGKWNKGTSLAPFDKEFYISIGLSVGGMREFPDDCVTGQGHDKPWRNKAVKGMYNFWSDRNTWQSTWNNKKNGLYVSDLKVYSL